MNAERKKNAIKMTDIGQRHKVDTARKQITAALFLTEKKC